MPSRSGGDGDHSRSRGRCCAIHPPVRRVPPGSSPRGHGRHGTVLVSGEAFGCSCAGTARSPIMVEPRAHSPSAQAYVKRFFHHCEPRVQSPCAGAPCGSMGASSHRREELIPCDPSAGECSPCPHSRIAMRPLGASCIAATIFSSLRATRSWRLALSCSRIWAPSLAFVIATCSTKPGRLRERRPAGPGRCTRTAGARVGHVHQAFAPLPSRPPFWTLCGCMFTASHLGVPVVVYAKAGLW